MQFDQKPLRYEAKTSFNKWSVISVMNFETILGITGRVQKVTISMFFLFFLGFLSRDLWINKNVEMVSHFLYARLLYMWII